MKENSFAQYISKEKLKGNYSSELNEGIGDFFKKDWYNTKKHLSGNLKGDEIELYRITGDFNDKAFREAIIQKCIDNVNKKAKEAKSEEKGDDNTGVTPLSNEEIDPEKVEELAQPTIQETIKKIINQVVGLARGTNSNYDPDLNPDELEKDDKLYNGGAKGYKYSWVQKDKLYIYFDSEDSARRFYREDLKEQKHLEVDESVISKMFSIEKCKRNKDKVYDKVKTEERHYKKDSPIPHETFDKECSKIIFDNIKDELIKNAKNNRYGKKIPVGRITWSWPEDEIKNFLNKCVKDGVNDVKGIKNKISDVFAEVRKAAENAGHFLYAKGTAKGNVNLNFETLEDAENFKEEFESEVEYGNLSNPADGKANSKFVEKAKTDKEIKAAKLIAKIVVMADEQFEQIKVTEEEAAAAEAKLQKSGKSVETYAVTLSLNKEQLSRVVEQFIKENGGEAVESGKLLDYLMTNGGEFDSLLSKIDEFCYSDVQRDGSVILHFETERAAAKFISEYNGNYDHSIFDMTDPEKSSANSKSIEEFAAEGKKVKNNKIARAITDNIDDKYKKYITGLNAANAEGTIEEIVVAPQMESIMEKLKEDSGFFNTLVHKGSVLQEAVIHAFNRVFEPITLSLIDEAAKDPFEGLTPDQIKSLKVAIIKYRRDKKKEPTPQVIGSMKKAIAKTNTEEVKANPEEVGKKVEQQVVQATPAANGNNDLNDPAAVLEKLKVSIRAGFERLGSLKKFIDEGKAEVKEYDKGMAIRFNSVDTEEVKNVEKEINDKLIAKDYFKVVRRTPNYKVK